jgi:hypothetical protein
LVVVVITAKAAKEIFKVCIVAFLLCTCGYITVQQLLIFYLILFGGISLNVVAPAISSMPSEWLGLKPAMILFKKFADENIEAINSFEGDELDRIGLCKNTIKLQRLSQSIFLNLQIY